MGKEMSFSVKNSSTYTITRGSVDKFKETMLEYMEEAMVEADELGEDETFSYTVEDIPDKIVEKALAAGVKDAYKNLNNPYLHSGFRFDDYFNSVHIECFEEDVYDCVYNAVAAWRTELNKVEK